MHLILIVLWKVILLNKKWWINEISLCSLAQEIALLHCRTVARKWTLSLFCAWMENSAVVCEAPRALGKMWSWSHLSITMINLVNSVPDPSYISCLRRSSGHHSNVACRKCVCDRYRSHGEFDLKLVGSGFMVSCYSIILFSAASVRAAPGRVRWYMMCHCSPNPLAGALVFLLPLHDSTLRRKNHSPTFFLTQPCTEEQYTLNLVLD